MSFFKKKETDEIDWGAEEEAINWDDYGSDGGFKSKKSKSGKRQAITEFGGSFYSGLKDDTTSRSAMRTIVKKLLPESYTRLWDGSSEVINGVKEIKDNAANKLQEPLREVTPALNTMNKAWGKNLPPKLRKKVDQFVTRQYDTLAQSYDKEEGLSSEEQTDATLNAIFKNRKYSDEQQRLNTLVTAKAIEDSSNKQFLSGQEQIDAILLGSRINERVAVATEKLAAFQDRIGANAMRKSLEIQLKQYFVSRKTLDVLEQTKAMQEKANEDIVKNTGLPEAQKILKHEALGTMAHQRLYGKILDGASNVTGSLLDRVVKTVNKKFNKGVNDHGFSVTSLLQEVAGKAEDDLQSQYYGDGKSKAESYGGNAYTAIKLIFGDKIAKKISKATKPYTDKVRNNSKVNSYGAKIDHLMDALPSWMDKSLDGHGPNQYLNGIVNLLGLSELKWKDNDMVRGSTVPHLDDQTYYNYQDHLALTEVIPAHLENIGHILEKIFSKNPDAPKMKFDYRKGVLKSADETSARYAKGMVSKRTKENVSGYVNEVVDLIDPKGELSPAALNDLNRYIVSTAQSGTARLDIRALASARSPITSENSDEIAELVSKTFGIENLGWMSDYDPDDPIQAAKFEAKEGKKFHRRSRNANKRLDDIRRSLPKNLPLAVEAAKTGNIETAVKAGLIYWDRSTGEYKLNREKELNDLTDDNYIGYDDDDDINVGGMNVEEAPLTEKEKRKKFEEDIEKGKSTASKAIRDLWNKKRPSNEKIDEVKQKAKDTVDQVDVQGIKDTVSKVKKNVASRIQSINVDQLKRDGLDFYGRFNENDHVKTAKDRFGGLIDEVEKQVSETSKEDIVSAANERMGKVRRRIKGLTRRKPEDDISQSDIEDATKEAMDDQDDRKSSPFVKRMRSYVDSYLDGFNRKTQQEKIEEQARENDKHMGQSATDQMASAGKSSLGGFSAFEQELLETLERTSAKTSVDISNQVLEAIRHRLDEPLHYQAGDGHSPDHEKTKKQKKSWFNRLVATPLIATGNGIKDYFKWSYTKAIPTVFKNLVTRPLSAVGSVASWALGGSGKGRRLMDIHDKAARKGVSDVYVKGQSEPALRKADIQAGKYTDVNTGKVIKKLKDITGAVQEGDDIRITEEQFKEGLMTIKNGKLVSIAASLLGGSFGLAKKAASIITAPHRFLAKTAWNLTKKLFTKGKPKAEDVYVKGESKPRLLGWLMAEGNYFDDNGKVILTADDIKGPVKDKEGNTLITLQDIQKGLTNKWGKRLRKSASLVGGLIGGAATLARKGVGLAGRAYMGGLRLLGRGVKGAFNKVFGKGKKASAKEAIASGDIHSFTAEMMAHQTNRLDDIYALLQRQFGRGIRKGNRPRRPKGGGGGLWDRDKDGIRTGSREDWLRKLKDKRAEDKANPKPEKKKRSLYGLISAIVGGVGTLIGAIKGFGTKFWHGLKALKAVQTAASLMSTVGGLFGGGKEGGKAGIFKKAFNFLKRSKFAKGALIAGGLWAGSSALSHAAGVDGQSTALMGGSEAEAYKQAVSGMGDIDDDSGSSSGLSGADGFETKKDTNSTFGNYSNVIKANLMSEVGAIGTTAGIAALYGKYGKKTITPKLPEKELTGWKGKLSTAKKFATENKYGRLILAGLLGSGLYTAKNELHGGDERQVQDLGSETSTSFMSTMGMEAALGLGLPYVMNKYRQHKLMKETGFKKPLTHVTPHTVSGVHPSGVMPKNPTMGSPKVPHPDFHGPMPQMGGQVAEKAAKMGWVARAGNMAKGFGKHIGPWGVGFAGLDAATTEGGAWDKTKAFGSSLLQTAAISKGWDLLSNKASRQALVQGGKSLLQGGARQALTRGATTVASRVAGSALAEGALAVGGTIAGAITLPVIVGAAVIAGIGVGGYMAWKRWWRKDKVGLTRFRMAQYGVDLDDKDQATAIGRLEEMALKNVTISGTTARFTGNLKVEQVAQIFGVQSNDKEGAGKVAQWFSQRFRPVFLTHLAVLNKMKAGGSLKDVDDIFKTSNQRMAYIDAANAVPDNPFDHMTSPFPTYQLKYDLQGVKGAYAMARREASHEVDKDGKSQTERAVDKGKSLLSKAKEWGKDAINATKSAMGYLGNVAGALGAGAVDYTQRSWNNAKSAASHLATGDFKGVWGDIKQQAKDAVDVAETTVTAVKTLSGSSKQKYNTIRKAAEKAGDPHPDVVAAQWAHESGWGKKQSGKNNYFGIKAIRGQAGTVVDTHEVRNGASRAEKAKFADYNSLDDGIRARVEFVQRNGVYRRAGYFEAQTPAQACMALQKAGYATDPKYAEKLCKIIAGCGYNPNKPSAELNKQGDKDNNVASFTMSPATKSTSLAGHSPAARNFQASQQQNNLPGQSTTSDGSANLTQMAQAGTVATSSTASGFIKSLDPKLIALGQKCTRIMGKDVDINGMVKGFMVCFYAMVGEAVDKKLLQFVQVNSANRSNEKQKELYEQYQSKGYPLAAKPGSSNHNFGIAIDINSANAETLAKNGLLDKYHFHRPLLNHPKRPEPWHIESHLFTRGSKDTKKEIKKAEASRESKIESPNKTIQSEIKKGSKATVTDQAAAIAKVHAESNNGKGFPIPDVAAKTSDVKTPDAPSNTPAQPNTVGQTDTKVDEQITQQQHRAEEQRKAAQAVENATLGKYAPVDNEVASRARSAKIVEQNTKPEETKSSDDSSNPSHDVLKESLSAQQEMVSVLKDIKDLLGKSNQGQGQQRPLPNFGDHSGGQSKTLMPINMSAKS